MKCANNGNGKAWNLLLYCIHFLDVNRDSWVPWYLVLKFPIQIPHSNISQGPEELIGRQLGCFNGELLLKFKWDHWKLPISFKSTIYFEAQLSYYEDSCFAVNLELYWKSFQSFY